MGEPVYRAQAHPRRSFVAASAGFASGRETPRGFLDACIERIEGEEPTVSAFAALDLDGARAAAEASGARWAAGAPRSPLDGCPVGVKDIVATRGLPTQMGSALYRGWQAPAEAACVAALRAAGAIVLGKTHTTEFAVGESPPTTNPWDPERTPGGSSSGSAAAVGAGMVPLALGTQTVGSILRPSSYCGAVGFKPTHGALPMGGIHPLARSLDHLGPIAASVADAWAAFEVLQRLGTDIAGAPPWAGPLGPARQPRRLARLRVEEDRELEPAAAQAFDELLEGLRARGVEVAGADDDGAIAGLERAVAEANATGLAIQRYEMRWPFAEYAARGPQAVGPRIREHLEIGESVDDRHYREALASRDALRAQVRAVATTVDGFVLPSASGVAPEGLAFTGSRTMLAPWSVIGGPAWSLPLLAVDGLPLGVQLAGAPGDDGDLVEIARWLMGE